jgi:hypothetical protein
MLSRIPSERAMPRSPWQEYSLNMLLQGVVMGRRPGSRGPSQKTKIAMRALTSAPTGVAWSVVSQAWTVRYDQDASETLIAEGDKDI